MHARSNALAIVGLLAALVATARPLALEANLDRDAIDAAIVFARQATRGERRAFHEAYQALPGEAIRRISLVSEYRRVVLLVEEKMRLLDRDYGVRQMTAALKPWRGTLEVLVEVQFHPQNNYVGVPLIDVLLVRLDDVGAPTPLAADTTDRRPRFGLFWDPSPPDAPWWPFPPPSVPVITGSEPLTGGWVQARFDAQAVARGRHEVVIRDGSKTLGRAEFDLGALR